MNFLKKGAYQLPAVKRLSDMQENTGIDKDNSNTSHFLADGSMVEEENVYSEKNALEQAIEKEKAELFSVLQEEIEDDEITDIEWDGWHLWITKLGVGCYRSDKVLDDEFVNRMAIRLSNIMKVNFSRMNPVLEANTELLRISIWHESRCGRKSIAIRKIPKRLRFGHEQLIADSYAPPSIISLIENCVTAHMNIVIGGLPHAGKTELLKYLSTYIPASEKAGVYEDNQEIHYRDINPGKKCVEFHVDENFTYADVIKAGLRHNVDWELLSESRGSEVLELLNALSNGGYCLTTMHLNDVTRLPDRMYNMIGENVSERFINNIYRFIDVGIIVECDNKQQRRIKQLAFFTRTERKNMCHLFFDEGELTRKPIPEEMLKRFQRYGIDNPLN